ncbi:NnrU family protein [Marinicaulis aureus]|uniref:NnrU family protein n=1 Tax=Hyphococcus aureus TaxID=2666033 RepID=A0ABW1KX92_9PROT
MALFLTGLIIFFGAHLFTGLMRAPRAAIISKVGEMPYKGLYSLVSIAGFVLIIMGWKTADASVIYTTPYWLRHVTHLLMLIAFILLTAAYIPAGKIAAGAKHPMLAGVKIWAFAHLLVNGELRSIILFGSFLAYAVIDRIAVKKRGETGRAAGPVINDVIAVVVGGAAFAAVAFYGHKYIAGVALF